MVTSPVTMSVSPGTVKQAQTADSGDFSQVLGSVNSGSAQKSQTSPQKTEGAAEGGFKFTRKAADRAAADNGGCQTTDIPSDSLEALTVLESASAMLSSVSAELTLKLEQYSDQEAKDKIIAALLEILKKLKEKEPEEGLSAAELLMSMLSAPPQYSADPQIEALVSELSVEMQVTTVTAEFSYEAAALYQTAEMPTELSADNTGQEQQDIPLALQENPAEATTAEVQSTEAQPADRALQLLSEILGSAKKELGLTEAKLTAAQPQEEAAISTHSEAKTAEISLNMAKTDRTEELNSILGGEKTAGEEQPKTETASAVHLEESLAENRPLENSLAAAVRAELPQEEAAPIRPPEVQTGEQILARMNSLQNGETEFTMVLNPESLGRITVKLVTSGERVAVQITAENPETRQLLEARGENLQTVLKNGGVELERYQVVTDREEAQLMQDSYEGSSKNPYSRNQQQQNGDDDSGEDFYELLQSI
ncbi:MAG: flagellar hook-length control protein FliK [Ruminiclostridium sp.]